MRGDPDVLDDLPNLRLPAGIVERTQHEKAGKADSPTGRALRHGPEGLHAAELPDVHVATRPKSWHKAHSRQRVMGLHEVPHPGSTDQAPRPPRSIVPRASGSTMRSDRVFTPVQTGMTGQGWTLVNKILGKLRNCSIPVGLLWTHMNNSRVRRVRKLGAAEDEKAPSSPHERVFMSPTARPSTGVRPPSGTGEIGGPTKAGTRLGGFDVHRSVRHYANQMHAKSGGNRSRARTTTHPGSPREKRGHHVRL